MLLLFYFGINISHHVCMSIQPTLCAFELLLFFFFFLRFCLGLGGGECVSNCYTLDAEMGNLALVSSDLLNASLISFCSVFFVEAILDAMPDTLHLFMTKEFILTL